MKYIAIKQVFSNNKIVALVFEGEPFSNIVYYDLDKKLIYVKIKFSEFDLIKEHEITKNILDYSGNYFISLEYVAYKVHDAVDLMIIKSIHQQDMTMANKIVKNIEAIKSLMETDIDY